MKKKKIITICSSASFYKDVLEMETKLKKLGYNVKIPKTARVMKKTGNYDVNTYKTWSNNPKDYNKKTAFMNAHFKKVQEADFILVVNKKKNMIDGYIGGNGLMEMTLAYILKKPIYILNPVGDYFLTEEIYGLEPIFINGDLLKLPR